MSSRRDLSAEVTLNLGSEPVIILPYPKGVRQPSVVVICAEGFIRAHPFCDLRKEAQEGNAGGRRVSGVFLPGCGSGDMLLKRAVSLQI